jgi:hypothetical protein
LAVLSAGVVLGGRWSAGAARVSGVVKGAFMSLGEMNASFTTPGERAFNDNRATCVGGEFPSSGAS